MNSDNLGGSILALMLFFGTPVQAQVQSSATLDITAIEQAMGRGGDWHEDVYKVSFLRKDLSVAVRGVSLKAGFALGTWIAFKQAEKDAVIDGDLVLTEDEVGPVVRTLRKEGIEISALHNHLIGEMPRLMYLHIAGKGDAGKMATHLKDALSLTATPMGPPSAKPLGAGLRTAAEEADFDAEVIQKELGYKGKSKDGVLHIFVPRPEQITMAGAILPPSMGMATALNFQSAGGNKVAATGDFVMMRDEVDRVSKALTEHGILITALHNHLVHGSPDLYFMHFWANDNAENVAKALRAGLDAMKRGG